MSVARAKKIIGGDDIIDMEWANKPDASVFGKGQAFFTDIETLGFSDGENWYQTGPVFSVNERTGAVSLTKSDVNLANVNNTADIDKIISTATQTALNNATYIVDTVSDLATVPVTYKSVLVKNLTGNGIYNWEASGIVDNITVFAGATGVWKRETQLSNRIGKGTPAGAPDHIITCVAGDSGVLTGTYKYAYTEIDPTGNGETILSPLSDPITVSSKKIVLTIPFPRRGMGGRYLYRTEAGGSTFKYLPIDLNGHGFYQTGFIDNIPDNQLQNVAPTVDTTKVFCLEVNDQVKFIRTHPDQNALPADFSPITGDPFTGTFSIDCYGQVFIRGVTSTALGIQFTGENGYQFQARYKPSAYDENDEGGYQVFGILYNGETEISPYLPLNTQPVLNIQATMPSAPSGTFTAMQRMITGAGNASQVQIAESLALEAGYIGSSDTWTFNVRNSTASSGKSLAINAIVNGASAQNIGINANVSGGTKNIALFGGLNASATGFSVDAALLLSNGNTAKDLIRAYSGTSSLVFYVDQYGDVVAAGYLLVGSSAALGWTDRGFFRAASDGVFNALKNDNSTLAQLNLGKVGIGQGLTNQVELIEVYDTAANAPTILIKNASTYHLRLGLNTSNQAVLGSTNATPILIQANSTATQLFLSTAGAIGIGTTSPDANALLDLTSTTKAFLPPRMTSTQRGAISNPVEGMQVYDLTLHKLCLYNGSAWEQITSTVI